jgi:hypothetical protein
MPSLTRARPLLPHHTSRRALYHASITPTYPLARNIFVRLPDSLGVISPMTLHCRNDLRLQRGGAASPLSWGI